MKLIEYLRTSNYFGDDIITILHIDNLYRQLSNQFPEQYCLIGPNEVVEPQYPMKVLSFNPDMDFPGLKQEYREQYNDNTPYDQAKQDVLETIPYKEKMDDLSLHENITALYAHSVGRLYPNVHMVPIGRDFKHTRVFKEVDRFDKMNKSILCYYNVTLPPKVFHWYGFVRTQIYEMVSKKEFVTCKKCDVHPRTYSEEDIRSYYHDLAKSKFSICPRGAGIDTYRLWDSIHMGCIPIVEKYEGYQQFENLPILFIDHWSEIETFSAEFLESIWNKMSAQDYHYDLLRFSYWKEKICG
jgi:hypothetical protein